MKKLARVAGLPCVAALVAASGFAAPGKAHVVVFGAAKSVPYSRAGDPAGAAPGEDSLKIRALLVDGSLKEWTTGDSHDVTDRSFVVRRAVRLNNSLPGDRLDSWVWQRGPWLLVDRRTGRIAALHLPDYDPGVSQVSWFRDYAAYCGLTPSGKSLYAVVAQIAARRPVLAKKLSAFDPENPPQPACGAPEWQRQPMRVIFHPGGHPDGRDAVAFDVEPGSAVLVEDSGDGPETAEPAN
ncbi:MAG TPA: hypothetical protein VKU93_02450 [Terracidiphilus sp.]|jgi:hypothetical protein|nr:hypothetical protein [Terracidiphilus sp.]